MCLTSRPYLSTHNLSCMPCVCYACSHIVLVLVSSQPRWGRRRSPGTSWGRWRRRRGFSIWSNRGWQRKNWRRRRRMSSCNSWRYLFIVRGLHVLLWLPYYCKHITHACTHARTHSRAHTRPPPSPFTLSLLDGFVAPNHDRVNAPFRRFRWRYNSRSLLHSNKQSCRRLGFCDIFGCFSHIKKYLG